MLGVVARSIRLRANPNEVLLLQVYYGKILPKLFLVVLYIRTLEKFKIQS